MGPYMQVKNRLVPGSSDTTVGASYSDSDENISRYHTYHYRLEDVDYDNFLKLHEQISVTTPPLSGIGFALASLGIVIGLIMIGLSLRRRI